MGANAQITGTVSENQAEFVMQFEGFEVTASFVVDDDQVDDVHV